MANGKNTLGDKCALRAIFHSTTMENGIRNIAIIGGGHHRETRVPQLLWLGYWNSERFPNIAMKCKVPANKQPSSPLYPIFHIRGPGTLLTISLINRKINAYTIIVIYGYTVDRMVYINALTTDYYTFSRLFFLFDNNYLWN